VKPQIEKLVITVNATASRARTKKAFAVFRHLNRNKIADAPPNRSDATTKYMKA
jgi:hypothetical protein